MAFNHLNISYEQIYDEQTHQYVIIDNRVFADCVTVQLDAIRQRAAELILEKAPLFKQQNASLGLLSAEETEFIVGHIQSIRETSNAYETEILQITWDGTEETRIAACDAVQSIRWPLT